MKVEVHLFATLATFLPPGAHDGTAILELPDGTTLLGLVRALGIPEDLARVSLVNGADAEPGRRLAAGDVVSLFPPLAGGGNDEHGRAPRCLPTRHPPGAGSVRGRRQRASRP